MKSIYHRITIVLFLGFIIQIVLVGTFYRQVLVRHVISEINQQENKRQSILQEAMGLTQKYQTRADKLGTALEECSKKYDVNFVVKNIDGDSIYTASNEIKKQKTIEEQGYVRDGGRTAYIVYGYFPAKITNIEVNIGQKRLRAIITLIMLILGILTLFSVYRILANPLKKLSKAINNLSYGNTLIEIPYQGDDEFGLLCRNFENMGRRLKKSEDNQQELLQAISHDINTPLTSIVGYSKRLLEDKVEEGRKKEYYETIYRRANDLKNITEELEDYGNINQESKYNKTLVQCNQYLNKLIEEIKLEVEYKGSNLKYINSIDDNVYIKIDINKLKRVFWNIVENSLKYAGERSVINIECKKEGNFVKFEIYDNGIGVAEEQLNRIFDRFYRVDTSRSRDKGGTGLGLAICKDIINKHSGYIGAFNREQNGLCVWFTIPVYA